MKIEKQFEVLYKKADQQLVFGWANVAQTKEGESLVDYQDDIIEPDELEKAAYNFVLNFRNTGEQHNPDLREKGKLVESMVFTKEKQEALGIPSGILPVGWYVGFKIDDPDAWAKLKKGKYLMFSIEGTGERVPI